MFLGIDWGERKIGLAMADGETRMAFGREIILNDKNVWQNLARFIQENAVEKVILGLSEHKIQNDNKVKIENFANEFKKRFDLEVIFTEEMFSTREAKMNLNFKEMKKSHKNDDSESARILLQGYLDLYFE